MIRWCYIRNFWFKWNENENESKANIKFHLFKWNSFCILYCICYLKVYILLIVIWVGQIQAEFNGNTEYTQQNIYSWTEQNRTEQNHVWNTRTKLTLRRVRVTQMHMLLWMWNNIKIIIFNVSPSLAHIISLGLFFHCLIFLFKLCFS